MNKKYCLLCLVVLILILLYFIRSVEGFESVPDECGTAGYRYSDGFTKLQPSVNDRRMYTSSECNKIDGAVFNNGGCYKLKNDSKTDDKYDFSPSNIDINYGEKCAGLKTMSTPPPNECSVDGTLLGIENKAFSVSKGDKSEIFPANSIRLYTKNECDKLKGVFSADILSNMKDDQKKIYIDLHGSDYGFCYSSDGIIQYSFGCNSDAAPSISDEASNLAKKHLKNWLA